MDKHGRKFAPYRSALAWYCWRALDDAEKKLKS
jgi:3-methyladenine DNA glycosylase/8-oxoguanine DNA glycosylase